MFGLDNFKYVIYIMVVSVIVSAVGYVLYDWHYEPIAELQKDKEDRDKLIKGLEDAIDQYNKYISDAYQLLYECENNITSSTLGGFIEGIGSSDDQNYTSDLSNLSS